jgi:hypothetical protein
MGKQKDESKTHDKKHQKENENKRELGMTLSERNLQFMDGWKLKLKILQ